MTEPPVLRFSLGTPGDSVVNLTRDSVAMGDDVDAPHPARVTYPAGMPLAAALHGIAVRYLPHVAGRPVGWRAEAAGRGLGWLVRSNTKDGATHTEVRRVARGAVLDAGAIHFVYIAANALPAAGP